MSVNFLCRDIGQKGAFAWTDECGRVCSRPYVLEGSTAEDRPARLEKSSTPSWTALKPGLVVIERHTRRGPGTQTLDAYVNVIRRVAGRHGVPVERSIACVSASKLALGRGIRDKAARRRLAFRGCAPRTRSTNESSSPPPPGISRRRRPSPYGARARRHPRYVISATSSGRTKCTVEASAARRSAPTRPQAGLPLAK